jgi:hypothetical protein
MSFSSSAGEEGAFLRSEDRPFNVIPPGKIEAMHAPYLWLHFDGTEAELREHLGQRQR